MANRELAWRLELLKGFQTQAPVLVGMRILVPQNHSACAQPISHLDRLTLMDVKEHHLHPTIFLRQVLVKHLAHGKIGGHRIIRMDEGSLPLFVGTTRCVAIYSPD